MNLVNITISFECRQTGSFNRWQHPSRQVKVQTELILSTLGHCLTRQFFGPLEAERFHVGKAAVPRRLA